MQMSDQPDMNSSSNERDINRDENDATNHLVNEVNYSDINENEREGDTRDVYYTYPQDDLQTGEMQPIPYMATGMVDGGFHVDPTAMQTAAAINHGMMFQNQAPGPNYSQFPMFNGMNSMYGAVPQYYGGNMPITMNPYYDPYGIINPLASAALNVEKTKKKTKKFICC